MTREEAIKRARVGLERLKTNLGKSEWGNGIIEAFETLIPELKESEDERIRKELLFFLKEEIQQCSIKEHADKLKEFVSYLGKQKEQKSLNVSAASEWLRKHVCNYMNSEYNEFHKCVEYDGSIDKERLINDFEEAMQKEQKPEIKYIYPAFKVGDTIKPKAYNESHRINEIKDGNYVLDNGFTFPIVGQDVWEVVEQKLAEWSEEDGTILNSVIRIITQFDDLAHEPTFAGPKWTHPYTKELNFLEKLRNRLFEEND